MTIKEKEKEKKSINNNISIANNLIIEFKKYLDVRYLDVMLAKLQQRSENFYRINTDLRDIIKYIEHNISLQRSGYSFFEKLLTSKPTVIDKIIKTKFTDWRYYICNQDKLIGCILAFCHTATNNKVKIFNFFKEDSLEDIWHEINEITSGLCYGLSSLFLLCSFISDRQNYKTIIVEEDDLRWFYRCIFLLQLGIFDYSYEQKQDITRFISLVLHFQNNVDVTGVSNNIFLNNTPSDFDKQDFHVINAEFSGANCIAYSPYNMGIDFITLLCKESSSSLYVQFSLGSDKTNSNHSVSLHKNVSGEFTFYDPNLPLPVTKISLRNEDEFLSFRDQYLEPGYDRFYVVMGQSVPKSNLNSQKRLRV